MRYFYDGTAADDDEDRDGEAREDDGRDDALAGDDDPDAADAMGDDPGVDGDLDGDDPELDADFPRGDGTADTEAVAYCPYCGELNELAVDPGGGSTQSYVEDCHVCCRPWRVTVSFDGAGQALVQLDPAD